MLVENNINIASIKEMVKESRLCHVAMIMDGNRRWAKNRFLPSTAGHNAGVKTMKDVTKFCDEFGIKYLTVYAFSTENWGRKKEEVDFLMFLLGETIKNELKELHGNNVRIKFLGDLTALNKDLQNILYNSEQVTAENTGLNLQIAINYGSRSEITSGIKAIFNDIQSGKLAIEQVDEKLVSDYLYTRGIPDPDLLIRTGGDKRISNYLLWQLAYTEIFVTETLWPDFSKSDFEKAVCDFARRERRFGKG